MLAPGKALCRFFDVHGIGSMRDYANPAERSRGFFFLSRRINIPSFAIFDLVPWLYGLSNRHTRALDPAITLRNRGRNPAKIRAALTGSYR